MRYLVKTYLFVSLALLQCVMCYDQTTAYPNRPITVVIPMGAGGTSDTLGRMVAPALSEILGQPVIIENRPGVNGLIGEEYFTKVKPDGYTIMLGSTSASNNLWLHNLSYDPRKAFVPVSLMTTLPLALIVNNKTGAKSVKEFIDYVKKSPVPINYAHWGDGSVSHLNSESLKIEAGIDMNAIPYKTSPQVLNDTISGQVEASFVGTIVAAQHINGGKIQVLGVTSSARTMVLPQVPTMAEAGFPRVDIESWFGMFVSQGTPDNIKNQINQALVKILQQNEIKAKLEAQGFRVIGNTPEQFSQFYLKDIEKNGKVIKALNLAK